MDYLRDLRWIARRELLSWAFMLVADPQRMAALQRLVRRAAADAAEATLLVHALRYGRAAPRTPTRCSIPAWYGERYPELASGGPGDIRALPCCAVSTRGRDPNPLFDTDWYLRVEHDVCDARATLGALPGIRRVRRSRTASCFDRIGTLRRNPVVAEEGINPLVHYLRYGVDDGRRLDPVGRNRLSCSSGLVAAARGGTARSRWQVVGSSRRRIVVDATGVRGRTASTSLDAAQVAATAVVDRLCLGASVGVGHEGDHRWPSMPDVKASSASPEGLRRGPASEAVRRNRRALEAARAVRARLPGRVRGARRSVPPIPLSSPPRGSRASWTMTRRGITTCARTIPRRDGRAGRGAVRSSASPDDRSRAEHSLTGCGLVRREPAGAIVELNLFVRVRRRRVPASLRRRQRGHRADPRGATSDRSARRVGPRRGRLRAGPARPRRSRSTGSRARPIGRRARRS